MYFNYISKCDRIATVKKIIYFPEAEGRTHRCGPDAAGQ